MAGPDFPGRSSLLSGLFGTLQSAAGQRASTSQVWSALRVAAANSYRQIQGITTPATTEQLEEQGRGILRSQGVGVREVNTYRGLAGQWLRAKDRLQDLGETDQITGQTIFTPPWARTGTGGVAPQYRARINWQILGPGGEQFNVWRTYDLGSVLTTPGILIGRARTMVNLDGDSDIPPGSVIQGAPDVTIETL